MTNQDKSSQVVLVINEVDCYKGNALNSKYATHKATQHQIMLKVCDNYLHLGLRNKPADSNRAERIVFEKELDSNAVLFLALMYQAQQIKCSMLSEMCGSKKEYEEAAKYNAPKKVKVKQLIQKMYKLENLELSFELFQNLINY